MDSKLIFFNEVSNKNSSFFNHDNILNGISESRISSFVNIDQRTKKNLFVSQLKNFEFLVSKRIDYLNSLHSLDDNWISGNSKRPSDNVIEISKTILKEFVFYLKRSFYKTNNLLESDEGYKHQIKIYDMSDFNIKIPKIIMGPIPTGGICLEFHADKSTALFVTIRNEDSKMELEVKIKDYYSDLLLDNECYRDLYNDYNALTWN